jgi:uncharacterized protein (DUF2267 family)
MFEEQSNEAQAFIKEVARELGRADDLKSALRITASVFHALRDLLTIEESLHLISQMPIYLKGVYVDGWHIGKKDRIKDVDELIEQLILQNPRTGPRDFGEDERAVRNVRAVFRVLKKRISDGQISDVIAQFPASLKYLWEEETII